ncbi:Hcp family type VI secretion system effector [Humibacillus xanthopallidus]|uniref:Hcp family type VI secretion system effector n=1 Tax=Humibacillus xanthopallidus TaxID=412689 RepID=UPI00384F5D05
MSDSTPTFNATRRNLLKGGALGLGTLSGGLALSGMSASLAAAADPLTGAPTAALATAGGADYFLSIDGIPGESADEDHRNWIEVLSYSWGASSGATAALSGGGSGAGRATVTDLFVSSMLSQASPQLFLAVMNGKHATTAILEGVRSSGEGDRAPFMRLSLDDVLVTSYQTGAAEETPFDAFSLAYGRISYSYWRQDARGQMGPEQVVRWDVKANKAF